MKQRIENAIIAAFIADALSLGVHWVYETSDIEQKYGRLQEMVPPVLAPYHEGKEKGEFTHYGDQMLVLLESVKKKASFDLNDFSESWQALFASYSGYIDHATKVTLEHFDAGKTPGDSGSQSTDLAGAVRIPPLLLKYGDDLEGLIIAARQQTAMTHNQDQVIYIAEWASRCAYLVLHGETPSKSMFLALDQMSGQMSDDSRLAKMVEKGYQTRNDDTLKTIAEFGQMCSLGAALPSSVHLIAKYEDNYNDGMIENIMAGGDSAARGILSGFIIGCHKDGQTISAKWINDLKVIEQITTLISA